MGHFAKINKENIVTEVILAEWDFLDANPQLLQDGEKWVRTSYNTYGGQHLTNDNIALRKNYAGIGFTYDEKRDAFIPPKPFNSWVLNENTCLWEAPFKMPEDGNSYDWNEQIWSWVKI